VEGHGKTALLQRRIDIGLGALHVFKDARRLLRSKDGRPTEGKVELSEVRRHGLVRAERAIIRPVSACVLAASPELTRQGSVINEWVNPTQQSVAALRSDVFGQCPYLHS